jgi:mannose-1-phosphate guanylyltransferase/mannose-6-phosphate isomerase-like protein (cupin superfamily)
MLQIAGEDTLIRQTIKRISGFVPPQNIWIVTTEDQAEAIKFHIDSLGPTAREIQFIKEPVGRNTAPAIGLVATYLKQRSPDSIMIVMPSDHAIPDREKFLKDVKVAVEGAKKDYLVTFGIKPTHPETGYGYIKVKKGSRTGLKGLRQIERFVEKPNLKKAKSYLSAGNYYWNSGIFVWKTSKILSEIQAHLPSLYRVLMEIEESMLSQLSKLSKSSREKNENPKPLNSLNLLDLRNESDSLNQRNQLNSLNSLNRLYSQLESVSIDYGIMERSSDVLMVPATFRWSDLGSWTSLDEIIDKDKSGNIRKGNTIDIGSQDSIVFAGERLIATLGLKDMVVVDTPDATLVTPKERVQEIRKIVEDLKRDGREEHLFHKTVEKPWGSYTVLEEGQGYKIKRIVLKPKARLSLQLHRKRSEHWVVVEGTAKVTRENETYLVQKGESTFIPVNAKHRLENPGEGLLQIIEVQNGDYLEEDDIERFEDDYGRGNSR